MNILWSVNFILPELNAFLNKKSVYGGGWMSSMCEALSEADKINLGIVSIGSNLNLERYFLNGKKFYLLPGGEKTRYNGKGEQLRKAWQDILDDFKPDVIHVYGTEYSHNLELIKSFKNLPILISLQGILTEYVKHYYDGLDLKAIFSFSFRDLLRGGIFADKRRFGKGIASEQEMLRSVRFVEGRTFWDYTASKSINGKLKYYFCPRMLRPAFYDHEGWDINKIERHTLYVSQATYPIKGFHILLDALIMLKSSYPDVKLYIAGTNIYDRSGFKKRLKATGYSNYINKKIKKAALFDTIKFVGPLNEKQIADKLAKTHVLAIPSAIENSPNSLAEGMILGIPAVASYVGGTPDMLRHGEEGFLYNFNEPLMLAKYVSMIFDSDELAVKLSENAKREAAQRHDRQKLVKTLTGIYTDIQKTAENGKNHG